MRAAVYQNKPQFGETDKNIEHAIKKMETVKADLFVLPELFSTGYQFTSIEEVKKLSEEIPSGNTCRKLMEYAKTKNTYIVFGMAERDGDSLFNSAVLAGPDGFIGRYRKTHLFYEEKLFFSPGNTGFNVFDIGKARLGIMICYDWWFPEAARSLALKGADIICHPANLVLTGCHRAMTVRSLENAVYSITANRIGEEERGGKEKLSFTGKSQIVDPSGQVLTSLEKDNEGIAVADIEIKMARNKTITSMNDRFNDRRPDLYSIS